MSQEEMEMIEAYVLDQLTHEEKLNFEQRIQADQNLQQEVELFKQMIISVEAREVQKTIAKVVGSSSVKSKSDTANEAVKIRSSRIAILKYLIPLAALLTGALFYFNTTKKAEKTMYAEYYSRDPGLPTAMGASAKIRFDNGMVDYKRGDIKAAIKQWEPILSDNQGNDTIQFYMAMALIENKQPNQAQVLLSQVIKQKESSFWRKSIWYQSLINIQQGNQSQAIRLLEMIKIDDWVYQKEVEALYQELTKD